MHRAPIRKLVLRTIRRTASLGSVSGTRTGAGDGFRIAILAASRSGLALPPPPESSCYVASNVRKILRREPLPDRDKEPNPRTTAALLPCGKSQPRVRRHLVRVGSAGLGKHRVLSQRLTCASQVHQATKVSHLQCHPRLLGLR